MNHEPRGPEMRPSGWRLRKACVGWLRRERKPNLSEPAKCSQRLAGFRWCNVRSAVWQPAKCCEHFAGAVVRQAILVRHAIQSVDARRGGALEVKKTPAQCCVRLAGHEGAMFQRVRLAGSIPRQCPYYDCNRPPRCVWSDEEKQWLRDLAARHVPHGTCLKGSGPMLGLSFDAEQGCWLSVCIHGCSRYCRLLKTFVVVIGKSEHEAAGRILM